MKSNVSKSKGMNFGRRDDQAKYHLRGTELVNMEEEKDLDTLRDPSVKFSVQCAPV